VGFSNPRRASRRKALGPLQNKKKDEEEESSKPSLLPSFSKPAWVEPLSQKVEDLSTRVDEFVTQQVWERIPINVRAVLTKIWETIVGWFPSLRLAVLSFATGAVLTLAAILVPVYSSVENLSEPVTLFETILADLEMGYVDPVDTNKLFETGISAM
jgi:hypothetical protein